MQQKKCCRVLCDNEVKREETITYRSKHGTIVVACIYFCDQCKLEDLLEEITSEHKLRCGGY
jgi:hypothetical protein